MNITVTEENYLKSLYFIAFEKNNTNEIGTNELAAQLEIKPASVSNMLKKLKEKNWITYEKYGKIQLTDLGKARAIHIIRKHRLWETFLHNTLGFSWDEVHEVAEQLEHIQSDKLINKIDHFLEYPQYDPHGDPIPNAQGELIIRNKISLTQVAVGLPCEIIGVKDDSSTFLRHVDSLSLSINDRVTITKRNEYDRQIEITNGNSRCILSEKTASNIFVRLI